MALEKRKYDGSIPLEKRRDNKFSVEFEHVSFKYPGSEEYVIKDLNLSFVIGERMAIVGKNGSGKTTFIKLLCRLYDVTEGCIKVNGVDIRKYDYQEYCRLFAAVFQDFQMFAFPLGENIAGGEDVIQEKAVDALNRAGMGERLERLPGKLDTYVGKEFSDEGVTFSGGEKQKLALARALLHDSPVYIFDEATSNIDVESENDIMGEIHRLAGKKTVILISHRLANVTVSDRIYVMEHGNVAESGSHETLLAKGSVYAKLWNAQQSLENYGHTRQGLPEREQVVAQFRKQANSKHKSASGQNQEGTAAQGQSQDKDGMDSKSDENRKETAER